MKHVTYFGLGQHGGYAATARNVFPKLAYISLYQYYTSNNIINPSSEHILSNEEISF